MLDDVNALGEAKPGVELYVPHRVAWVSDVPGAQQAQGMS